MTTRQEIETAIKQLDDRETHQLFEWFQTYIGDRWEQEMQADLESGKLDSLIARAEADIATHKVKELDEILYNS